MQDLQDIQKVHPNRHIPQPAMHTLTGQGQSLRMCAVLSVLAAVVVVRAAQNQRAGVVLLLMILTPPAHHRARVPVIGAAVVHALAAAVFVAAVAVHTFACMMMVPLRK